MLTGILLIAIALFNLITIFLLQYSKNEYYIRDTIFFILSILFASAASITGIVGLYAGTFIYAGHSIKLNNILKLIVLFSGLLIGHFTNNYFYTYCSLIFTFLYSCVRFVESFIDFYQITSLEEKNKKTGISN